MDNISRKSWLVTPKAGSFNNLRIREDQLPPLQSGEVTVEVKACGLNFADIFAIKGLYSATPKGEFVPGLEFSGIVTRVEAKSDFKEGDRVMGVTRFGGYTTHINIAEQYVTSLPDDWSFEQGSAFLVQVLTAYYGLVDLGNIQENSTVLIHSAAGGVGVWANRIAKNFNAYTIGTIGSESKIDFLKDEGYDDFIVRGNDFKEKLTDKLNGRKLDIVMECIGGSILMDSFKCLGKEGRLITFGSARFAQQTSSPNKLKLLIKYLTRPMIDPMKLTQSNKGLLGFNLIYLFEHAEKMNKILDELSSMNIGKPVVGHSFKFDELKNALELFQSGKTTGKVILTH